MDLEVTCLRCEDFFKIIPGEAAEFIKEYADRFYLMGRVPFPKELREYFNSRVDYVLSLVEYHCPYCRTIVFGRQHKPSLPSGQMSESDYVKIFESEVRRRGGFQIREHKERIAIIRGR